MHGYPMSKNCLFPGTQKLNRFFSPMVFYWAVTGSFSGYLLVNCLEMFYINLPFYYRCLSKVLSLSLHVITHTRLFSYSMATK